MVVGLLTEREARAVLVVAVQAHVSLQHSPLMGRQILAAEVVVDIARGLMVGLAAQV